MSLPHEREVAFLSLGDPRRSSPATASRPGTVLVTDCVAGRANPVDRSRLPRHDPGRTPLALTTSFELVSMSGWSLLAGLPAVPTDEPSARVPGE
jgi:hypothetical protein